MKFAEISIATLKKQCRDSIDELGTGFVGRKILQIEAHDRAADTDAPVMRNQVTLNQSLNLKESDTADLKLQI
jgi:hypothetical protein